MPKTPRRLAHFWASALGYVYQPEAADTNSRPEGVIEVITDPTGQQASVSFVSVPEAKTAKNRLHLDIRPTGDADLVAALVESGGVVLAQHQTPNETHIVMQDPEGNEFCVVASELVSLR